jgi:hypothetical protein
MRHRCFAAPRGLPVQTCPGWEATYPASSPTIDHRERLSGPARKKIASAPSAIFLKRPKTIWTRSSSHGLAAPACDARHKTIDARRASLRTTGDPREYSKGCRAVQCDPVREWREQYTRCCDFEPIADAPFQHPVSPIFDQPRVVRAALSPGSSFATMIWSAMAIVALVW